MKKHNSVVLALLVFLFLPAAFIFGENPPSVEWVAICIYPTCFTDMDIDASGNFYVTGQTSSYTNADYITVKYDNSGHQVWLARYGGPCGRNDIPEDIVVDSFGNVYVTGRSEGPVTYDYLTIKYSPDGVEEWVGRYDGPIGDQDEAAAMAIDSYGNVYVTGKSRGENGVVDCVTIKYNASGDIQWLDRYDSPSHSDDRGNDIVVDALGNAYVTGNAWLANRHYEFLTIKYDIEGNRSWVAFYGGPGYATDIGRKVAVDTSGNVFVTGSSRYSSVLSYATVKYDSDGNLLWAQECIGDMPEAIIVDSKGDVVVTGYGWGEGRIMALTVKYDQDGNESWVARYKGPANYLDRATAIAIDASDNIYIAGTCYANQGLAISDCIVKYSPGGDEIWVAMDNHPVRWIREIRVDDQGNVFIAGNTAALNDLDGVLIKYRQVIDVDIDIKPGSFPNSINLGSNGNIPVVIFSTSEFDATQLDPLTISLAGSAVQIKGKGTPMYSIEDVNGDGQLDMIVHVDTTTLELSSGDTEAILEGQTYDGQKIRGIDTVRIVPE